MKPYQVNADYESVLFHLKSSPPVVNQAIEFLLFFLESRTLYSRKKYSQAYLEHVKTVTGREAAVTSEGAFENYWGPLNNFELEKWWNSKLTSTQLLIDRKWCEQTRILRKEADLAELSWDETYVLKDPTGMSGQKFQLVRTSESISERRAQILRTLASGHQILEPWFDRKFDFSQYVFPDGKVIAYQNHVDGKFQYKGTLFSDHETPTLESLPFYSRLSPRVWEQFRQQTQEIIQFYSQKKNQLGYSIDSFVYEEGSELKIRAMSEINYRRTMGQVTYELSKLYGTFGNWSALLVLKCVVLEKPLWEILKPLREVLVLSPGDSRFDLIFLSAGDEASAREVVSQMNALLAHTELSVQI